VISNICFVFQLSNRLISCVLPIQQYDSVLDPVSIYAHKAQLVTLKWREIDSIDRFVAAAFHAAGIFYSPRFLPVGRVPFQ
jgi:hypothetical protein